MCFLIVLVVYSFLQDIVHNELRDRMPWYYWKGKLVVFLCAVAACVLSTVLRLTVAGKASDLAERLRWTVNVIYPAKFIASWVLLACVLVNFVVMLAAALGGLAFFLWYNPNIYKLVKNTCKTGYACNMACAEEASYCCAMSFDTAHRMIFNLAAQNVTEFMELAADFPPIPRDVQPGTVKNLVKYFGKHPVECVPGHIFDIEEAFAANGKTYAMFVFVSLFVAALLYNSAAVYVFEVQNAVFHNMIPECVANKLGARNGVCCTDLCFRKADAREKCEQRGARERLLE